MNDVLLLKWWWRFGMEKECLWRRVVCEIYEIPQNRWLPSLSLNGKISRIQKDVLGVEGRNMSLFNLSLKILDMFWEMELGWIFGEMGGTEIEIC